MQFIFDELEKAMKREGVKDSDLYDWEKADLSTATTTTSTAQYRSTHDMKMARSDANTHSSHDKHEIKKQEHVLQQNKLNKVEGGVSCVVFAFQINYSYSHIYIKAIRLF